MFSHKIFLCYYDTFSVGNETRMTFALKRPQVLIKVADGQVYEAATDK